MEKAQILSKLKAQIGTTDNRFDITISKFIDRKKLAEVSDTDLNLEQYTDDLKWMYEQATGMANHEIAAARKAWEQEPKPTPAPAPAPEPTPSAISPEVQALLDGYKQQLDSLANQMKANQQQASIDAIKSSLVARGKELKANEKLWEIALAQVPIVEGSTVESIEAVVKPAYEKLQTSVFGNADIKPYGNVDTDPDACVGSDMDAFFQSKGIGKSE